MMENISFRIFVSYSTANLPHADQLRNSLADSPVDLFIAEHSILPGQQLSNSIEEAIDACDIFVLIWSTQAESSKWVPIEIGQAKAKQKPILPIVLHKDVTLPPFISDLKYIDATEDPEMAFQEARGVILHHIIGKFPELAQTPSKTPTDDSVSALNALLLVGIGAFLFWALTRE